MSQEMDLDAVQAAFASYRGGRYCVDRFIGKGGMGTVFAGFDTGFRKAPCAIKVINLDLLGNEQILARFRREAEIMVRVKHPAVVEVFDLDELDGLPFIVLEWVPGGSLSSYIDTHGPLGAQMAVNVMVIVCSGIEAAHAQGVIHRDIKPDNILLELGTGRPKVTDFGIAMKETNATRLTQDGTGMGSYGFMAPEQMEEAKNVDARADVHALGVTLWSILAGSLPPKLFFLAVETDPKLFEGIPDVLAEIIRKASQLKPEDRYGSVAELREALIAASKTLATPGSSTLLYSGLADPRVPAVQPLLLPVPFDQTMATGATFEGSTGKPAPASKPDRQAIAARLASPPMASRLMPTPAPADTMHEGSAEMIGGSKTQFAQALARTRRTSMARATLIASFLAIGGVVAWWWNSRDQIVPIISQPPVATATTVPQTPNPELAPATPQPVKPVTTPESIPRRQAEATTSPQQRAGIEIAAVAPASQAATLTEPPTKYPKIESEKPTRSGDKPGKGNKPPKPGKEKKPRVPRDGKTAVALAPAVPTEAVRVGVAFPEGESIKVWLVGSSGRHSLPGSVPPGTYKVFADFPSGERVAISSLVVETGSAIRISCIPQVAKCTVR